MQSVICQSRRFTALLSLIACWIISRVAAPRSRCKACVERDLAERYLYLYRIGLAGANGTRTTLHEPPRCWMSVRRRCDIGNGIT